MSEEQARPVNWVNRIRHWRTHIAQLVVGPAHGTPPFAALEHMAEQQLLQRIETNAIVGILLTAGIVTKEDAGAIMQLEAQKLEAQLERRFPGFRATDEGIIAVLAVAQSNGHMPRRDGI